PHSRALALTCYVAPRDLPSFPTRRSSDLAADPGVRAEAVRVLHERRAHADGGHRTPHGAVRGRREGPGREPGDRRAGETLRALRSEEHTSELQSLRHLVCRLLLEKKKNTK